MDSCTVFLVILCKTMESQLHPRVFLDTFWRNDIRNEIFVAMSFDARFDRRWQAIFRLAIESISVNGQQLKAVRVDIRKSGDSILSEINDGIAHSQVVLADISAVDSITTDGIQTLNGRNRWSAEVLAASS